jgi:predicted transcriptional regulator
MGMHRWKDVQKRKLSREQIDQVRRKVADEVLEMNLRSLRESLGKTQDEIARLADVTQSQLSKIERRDDHLISTLRRYVRALGGDIEVIAVVGEKRIALRGV